MKSLNELLIALGNGETLVNSESSAEIFAKNNTLYAKFDGKTLSEVYYIIWSEFNYADWKVKPKTININGFEVPEPLKTPLKKGEFYYVVNLVIKNLDKVYWDNLESEIYWLKLGLLHKTKEAAELHKKALLSLTQQTTGDEEH